MAPGTMSWRVVGRYPSRRCLFLSPHGSRPNSFKALQYLYFIHLIDLIRSVPTLLEQDQRFIQRVVDIFKDGLCQSLNPQHLCTRVRLKICSIS